MIKKQNVYSFKTPKGHVRYVLAVYDQEKNQYKRIMTKAESRLTGCDMVFSRTLEGMAGYGYYCRRLQAVNAAYYRYGYVRSY